ncbi:TadE/TadG family type IV pilus assembly protein [Neogemmobacter tilapiae]|uniref:Pilus assembly protein n=1 Tax=Neogemmobacter tilapiae TaxID=875041 RepID=A0A918WIJ1_9RHOB|nr:hypothetical protein [Gemmobacter tilapiae]GHC54751.1 hypothetical protein GCM10007315_17170 [Gemmobacter tilapiae]
MEVMKRAVLRFLRDEKGLVLVEFVLILPLLIWTVVAMYSFWDTFRVRNQFQKATHTISNIISRTKKATPLGPDDITGYHSLMNYLILNDTPVSVRITEYKYFQAPTDAYQVQWSCRRGSAFGGGLTNADLASMRNTTLPIMANGDTHILLETRMSYSAPFAVNFSGFGGTSTQAMTNSYVFHEIVSERPRDGDFTLSSCN